MFGEFFGKVFSIYGSVDGNVFDSFFIFFIDYASGTNFKCKIFYRKTIILNIIDEWGVFI